MERFVGLSAVDLSLSPEVLLLDQQYFHLHSLDHCLPQKGLVGH